MITGGLGGLGSPFTAACAAEGQELFVVDRYPRGGAVVEHFQQRYPVDIGSKSCSPADARDRARLLDELQLSGSTFRGLINVVGWESEGAFLERTWDDLFGETLANQASRPGPLASDREPERN